MNKLHKTSIVCLASSVVMAAGCSLDVEVKDAPDMLGVAKDPPVSKKQVSLELKANGCTRHGTYSATYSVSQEGSGIKIQYPNCTVNGGAQGRFATDSVVQCTLPYPEELKQIFASAPAYVRVEESYWLPNVQLDSSACQKMASFGSQGRIALRESTEYPIPGVRASGLSTVVAEATPAVETVSTVSELPRPVGAGATDMLSVIFHVPSSCIINSASSLNLVAAHPEWAIKRLTLSSSPNID